MKRFLFAITLAWGMLGFAQAQQQVHWGVGGRLGDPGGLSVKRYTAGGAVEVNFGQAYIFNGTGYYRHHFNGWYLKKHNYQYYNYTNHYNSFPWGLQVHFLRQKPLSQIDVKGLHWYYGAGAQLRWQTVHYSYRYRDNNRSEWVYVHNERYANVDMGIDGVLGLEYFIPEVPISVFADVNLFLEIVDYPSLRGQGGIGVRYTF